MVPGPAWAEALLCAGEEDLVAIDGVDPDLRRLELTPSNRRLMGYLSIGGIPGAVIVVGFCVWLGRRRY